MRIATAFLVGLCVAGPASAQTIRVTVDRASASDLIREVHRIVASSLGPLGADLRADIGDTIRAITGHVAALGRLDAVRAQSRTFKAEQTARETRTLSIGASGALDLDTLSGDITVTAGGGRDATIEIVRRARGRTDADARLGLERVKVEVEQRPDRARVRTVYPDQHNPPYTVDVSYVIAAPAGTRVTARTVSGNVTVKGMRGDVEAAVTSGHVDLSGSRVSQAKTISGPVTLTDVETDGSIDIRTVSGDITLQNVKAHRLTADAVASGTVIARNVTCDAVVLKTLSGAVEYAGPLSKTGRYELNAFSGPVRFLPSGPVGFELQASTFSGTIRPDPSMQFRDISLSRRSLRGTFGDGSAVVILQTFSGNVTVGK